MYSAFITDREYYSEMDFTPAFMRLDAWQQVDGGAGCRLHSDSKLFVRIFDLGRPRLLFLRGNGSKPVWEGTKLT